MRDHFSLLFAYHDWAHRRILHALANLDDAEEARRLFTHLILCQHGWMKRIQGQDTRGHSWFAEDNGYDLDQCEAEWTASLTTWVNYLDTASESELQRTVAYTSSEGPTYQSTVAEITFQVLNHSTHHRAQIARMIRAQGHTPPATDYIFFSRRKL